MRREWWLLALLAVGCNVEDEGKDPGEHEKQPVVQKKQGPEEPKAPGAKTIQPALPAEKAPPASPRASGLPSLDKLTQATKTYFQGNIGRRVYVQLDKPLYQPGETIWLKVWDLKARDLGGDAGGGGIRLELVSPKGAVVVRKQLQLEDGTAPNDFEIPAEAQGGEYKVRATTFDGATGERPVIVSAYEPPRIKKKLEFVRKAYGPGDEVVATIEVKRPTGEPLGNHALTAAIRLDGQDLPRVALTTNAEGGGLVRFPLPADIARGDGLLTVLVDDGGVTESISKRVPIVLKKLQFSFFPEGGQMIEGLPTRLYFEAKNTIDKPADVEGRVVDDHGQAVAEFRSYDRGLGRIEFTPGTGRTYHAEITKPVGITESYPLPLAQKDGCALRSFDDPDGQEDALRVAVRCSDARKVIVVGMLRENLIDAAAVDVKAGDAAVVYLKSGDAALNQAQGVARVTAFDDQLHPLAERIVYRNRRNSLKVEIKPDHESYVPRQQVALKVTTKTAKGTPQPAELALSVVDDTVISFADDKTGHMLSRLFLEPEIPGQVEEPNFYFDLKEEKSALAMDLLMGTRGWRKFEWQPVLEPPPPAETIGGLGMHGTGMGGGGMGFGRGRVMAAPRGAAVALEEEAPMPVAAAMPAPPPAPPAVEKAAKGGEVQNEEGRMGGRAAHAELDRAAPAREPVAPAPASMAPPADMPVLQAAKPMAGPAARREMAADDLLAPEPQAKKNVAAGDMKMDKDADFKQPVVAANQIAVDGEFGGGFAPVRVFPAPDYSKEYDGPRTDFRETVFWAPRVRTDKTGEATVTFFASDAVTSFRVFAEGAGGGLAGREEQVIQSKLPFSMDVKLPVAVSNGDTIELPLTLTNERDAPLPLSLTASFGDLLKIEKNAALPGPAIDPKQRASLYYGVKVTGQSGKSQVSFGANAGGLKDEFTREVTVEPLGFPQMQSASGTLKGQASHTFDLGQALPDTATATLKLYPSPVATLTSGLDGLLREPSGCFEQTSSTNYPNVMIAGYLKANDVADPALTAKVNDLLDKGYNRLVGFETPQKGYEWFGQVPANEALTAYGLLEFTDTRIAHGGVDEEMLARTARWLKSRRDGKGGFQRDDKALDSFGRASPEVTDAYITFALTEAGLAGDFGPEVDAQARKAADTKDPYILALATRTLLDLPERRAAGEAAARRLAGMQGQDGRWTGADHSITRSGGTNLDIETTALAVMALLNADGFSDNVRHGVEWLNNNRGGFGEWGATQATVLALKAMTEYATKSRKTQSSGRVTVLVNGQPAGEQAYEAGRRDPLVFENLGKLLKAGPNTIELRGEGGDELPYSIAVEFRSLKPATHPNAAVEIQTALEKTSVPMGENVRLNVTVKNRTAQGQPMTVARVGLPGGLAFQTWQLKELVDKHVIGFYETRPREVVLYFRDLAPSAVQQIPLDLVAQVPGTYTGPASRAYLYYTDDQKFWTDPVKVTITR
jgi:hypothetical protein